MRLIRNVATIGVENIGLLNVQDGELIGKSSKMLIQNELLDKIKFINEGEFVEKKGAPALKLIGEVEPIDSKKVIRVVETDYKAITQDELYAVFFDKKIKCDQAKEFIHKITYESTVYYPIYFYLVRAKYSREEAIKIISSEHGPKKEDLHGPKKEDLISRIVGQGEGIEKFKSENITTGSSAAKAISNYYNDLKLKKSIDEDFFKKMDIKHLRYFSYAVTHLNLSDISEEHIFPVLKKLYHAVFSRSEKKMTSVKTSTRKSICHIDLLVNGNSV